MNRKKYWMIVAPSLIVWTVIKFKVLPGILHNPNLEAIVYLAGAVGLAFLARIIAKNS